MKLGIACSLPHSSCEEWAARHKELGLSAVVFPCSYTDSTKKIDEYVNICKEFDLQIAEVGAWKNVLTSDPDAKSKNIEYCVGQLELAEYIGANCCVNISGTSGEIWDGAYRENYFEKTYAEIIACVQNIIDRVNPKKTFYTLEPMPWLHPYSPEDYLKMIKDINRNGFAVHMDIFNMINTPEKYLFNKEFTDNAFSVLGKYIKSCHIKDIVMKTNLPTSIEETAVGKGGFDLKNYINQIDNISSDMPVIIEHLESEEGYIKAVKHIEFLMNGGKKDE